MSGRWAGGFFLVSSAAAALLAVPHAAAQTGEVTAERDTIGFDTVRFDPIRFDSVGDFGGVGLLQVPTARMAPDGQFALSASRETAYERYSLTAQALPGLETTVRQIALPPRGEATAADPAGRIIRDRSIDIKLRLNEESAGVPALAVGIRDVDRSGLFGGDYLVASRRYFDWDFTLGLAWGRMGSRANLRNPFCALSNSMCDRPATPVSDGRVSRSGFFRGERVALFGGSVWRTPIPGLTLTLELDGNDYRRNAPPDDSRKVSSPVNFGVGYAITRHVDVALAWERGTTAMLQFTFKDSFKSGRSVATGAPAAIRSRAVSTDYSATLDPASAARVTGALEDAGFAVERLQTDPSETALIANVTQRRWPNQVLAAGRAARAIANSAPARFDTFTIANIESGLESHRVSIQRSQLEKADQGGLSAEEMWPFAKLENAPQGARTPMRDFVNPKRYPAYHWQWSPSLRQGIGDGPNSTAQILALGASTDWELARGWSIQAEIGAVLGETTADAAPQLAPVATAAAPHVRSDLKEYLRHGGNGLRRAQLDYAFQPRSGWYGTISAGLFETMFGGAGGELIYRPAGERWSFGGNLYKIQQRAYSGGLRFRDYQTVTGHLEARYRWPMHDVEAKLGYGRYLAGDKGIGLELVRRFAGGAQVGVWLTSTGGGVAPLIDGRVGKGMYILLPFDRTKFTVARGEFAFDMRSLSRDAGQQLEVRHSLADRLTDTDDLALARQWPSLLR